MNTKTTINGIDIVEDGDVTHFSVSDEVKKQEEVKRQKEIEAKANEPSSLIGKIVRWFNTSRVVPYVKVRDRADSFDDRKRNIDDIDAGSDGNTGVEAGVRISF